MVAEKFQIYSVKTTANTFVSQKIESVQFYSCPQAKLSTCFCHYLPDRRGLSIPAEQHFLKIFFSEQKEGGEDYVVEKITKINKGLVRSFDKFHDICNLCIFGLFFCAII